MGLRGCACGNGWVVQQTGQATGAILRSGLGAFRRWTSCIRYGHLTLLERILDGFISLSLSGRSVYGYYMCIKSISVHGIERVLVLEIWPMRTFINSSTIGNHPGKHHQNSIRILTTPYSTNPPPPPKAPNPQRHALRLPIDKIHPQYIPPQPPRRSRARRQLAQMGKQLCQRDVKDKVVPGNDGHCRRTQG